MVPNLIPVNLLFLPDLPANILEHIIAFLNLRDVISLMSTSTCLNSRLKDVQIKWTAPIFIRANVNQHESNFTEDVLNGNGLNSFLDQVIQNPLWSVKRLVLCYNLYGAESILTPPNTSNPKCLFLSASLIRNVQNAFKFEKVSLKIVIKDARMSLYQGEPIRLNVDLTDLLLSSANVTSFEVKVHSGSTGITCNCFIDPNVRNLGVQSNLERFMAPSPCLMFNVDFIRHLTKICPNLMSIKVPKRLKSLDFM